MGKYTENPQKNRKNIPREHMVRKSVRERIPGNGRDCGGTLLSQYDLPEPVFRQNIPFSVHQHPLVFRKHLCTAGNIILTAPDGFLRFVPAQQQQSPVRGNITHRGIAGLPEDPQDPRRTEHPSAPAIQAARVPNVAIIFSFAIKPVIDATTNTHPNVPI